MKIVNGQVVKPFALSATFDDLVFRALGLAAIYGIGADRLLFSYGENNVPMLAIKTSGMVAVVDYLREMLISMGWKVSMI